MASEELGNICTSEDLEKECNNLKELCKSAQAEEESTLQELYSCKRELETAKVLEGEYVQEIESLQGSEKVGCRKWQAKVNELEKELADLAPVHRTQIDQLEQESAKRDGKLCELEKLVKSAKEDHQSDDNVIDVSMTEEEQEHLAVILAEKVAAELKVVSLMEENLLVARNISDLKHELATLNENFNCKKEQLYEANKIIQTLEEDIMLTKNELDLLKINPFINDNSEKALFAEVNDRRLQLQNNMSELKTNFFQMRKEKCDLLNKISDIQNQISVLSRTWEEEQNEREADDFNEEHAYKLRITNLESLQKLYEEELSHRQAVGRKDLKVCGIEILQVALDHKNSVMEKALQLISGLSLSESLLSRQCKETNDEIGDLKEKATRLNAKVLELTDDIEMFEWNDLTVTQNEEEKKIRDSLDRLRSAKELKELANEDEKSKENAGCLKNNARTDCRVVQKKVQFDAAEPRVTERKALRTGGKIIMCKPTYIPSIKKKEL